MPMPSFKKLSKSFYLDDTLTVAKNLIGKYIVREKDRNPLIVKITETEGYIGMIDKACHAYKGKRTPRTESLFLEGGHAYVYLIYGMYYCLNVVTEPENIPCAVLIRGGELVADSDTESLSYIRYKKSYNELSPYQLKNFVKGPGKLCKALDITKEFDKISLMGNNLYICEGESINPDLIKTGKRINIDYAEEAINFPWRFYV